MWREGKAIKKTPTEREVHRIIRASGNAKDVDQALRFFKTGIGEYGEGDQFLGIRVPVIRQFVKQYRHLQIAGLLSFLQSPYHEERLFGVLSLVDRYKVDDEQQKRLVYKTYLENSDYVNNWDLVDGSAHLIVGPHLQHRSRKPLYTLAKARNLWRRRIAIMSTYHYIRQGEFVDTLELAAILRDDREDLIHKATGWMLREVGNRDRKAEEKFLLRHYKKMPRTMLRYAIEKFPDRRRKAYLNGKI